jgi:hypothetical protein
MTDERQHNVPVLFDDTWEPPPQPDRGPVTVIAALIGLALIVTCVQLLKSRERGWEEPDDVSIPIATPAPVALRLAPAPTATSSHTGLRVKRETLVKPLEAPASPPPRRPVGTGYLSINSSPWAEVAVDGHVVGNTPQVRIRVTPGRHHLVLVREGFQTHSAWVNVSAGGTVRLTDITLAKIPR